MSYDLGFIGGGNMSTAIVKGIIRSNLHPPAKIWISGPHLETLRHFRDFGCIITTKNGEIYFNCDIIFLGIKPNLLGKAVDDIINTMPEKNFRKPTMFVSMLAGTTIKDLHMSLGKVSPTLTVIRIMPNLPATVGSGACLLTPDPYVTNEQCSIIEKLMTGCGVVEVVPENLMDSLGSLVGCGPAFMYIVMEALADGAVKQGAPRDKAMRLAAQVVMGSGQLVLQTKKHPAQLKDEVCSPGGTTIAGVAELEEGKIRSTLIKAIEASTKKSKEMGAK